MPWVGGATVSQFIILSHGWTITITESAVGVFFEVWPPGRSAGLFCLDFGVGRMRSDFLSPVTTHPILVNYGSPLFVLLTIGFFFWELQAEQILCTKNNPSALWGCNSSKSHSFHTSLNPDRDTDSTLCVFLVMRGRVIRLQGHLGSSAVLNQSPFNCYNNINNNNTKS